MQNIFMKKFYSSLPKWENFNKLRHAVFFKKKILNINFFKQLKYRYFRQLPIFCLAYNKLISRFIWKNDSLVDQDIFYLKKGNR